MVVSFKILPFWVCPNSVDKINYAINYTFKSIKKPIGQQNMKSNCEAFPFRQQSWYQQTIHTRLHSNNKYKTITIYFIVLLPIQLFLLQNKLSILQYYNYFVKNFYNAGFETTQTLLFCEMWSVFSPLIQSRKTYSTDLTENCHKVGWYTTPTTTSGIDLLYYRFAFLHRFKMLAQFHRSSYLVMSITL